MTPALIAICGSKRSGKDTLANYLVEKYGYQNIKVASPLKKLVQDIFGFSDEQVGEGNEKDIVDATWGIAPRQALQFFGTEVMQYKIQELLPNVGRKFWIDRLIKTLEPNKKYVVSDLRFVHEYEELAARGVYVIKVLRGSSASTDTHCSEQEYYQIPANVCIVNDATIEDLLIKLDHTMATH